MTAKPRDADPVGGRRRTEYRLTWARMHPGDGQDGPHEVLKWRTFRGRHYAERWIRLLGPEPWTAFKLDPDELPCCNGMECACGGMTNREAMLARRGDLPPVTWFRLESREVHESPWKGEPHAD